MLKIRVKEHSITVVGVDILRGNRIRRQRSGFPLALDFRSFWFLLSLCLWSSVVQGIHRPLLQRNPWKVPSNSVKSLCYRSPLALPVWFDNGWGAPRPGANSGTRPLLARIGPAAS